jgi:4-methyl-5(b-hydroxyethyl)-thiazole monophosphate biosynthesis
MVAACVLLVDGFEETEAVTVIDVLRRAEVQTSVLGVSGRKVTGSHGITILVDASLTDVAALGATFDAVVLPGGMPGAAHLRDNADVKTFVCAQHAAGAVVAAICAAPIALAAFGLLAGRRATCFPGFEGQLGDAIVDDTMAVVVDGAIVTSRGVGTALPFALTLVERLVSAERSAALRRGMLVPSWA